MVTKEDIIHLLKVNNLAVERAIVVLYDRQTRSEQSASSTIEVNGRGFSSSDASLGTYLARWIVAGKHLDGKFLAQARNMSLKYTRQLFEAAEEKAAKQKVNDAKIRTY